MAVDYASVSQKKTILDATADAAALAAVAPARCCSRMRPQRPPPRTCSMAKSPTFRGLNYNPVNLTVTSTSSSGIRNRQRELHCFVLNTFGILGKDA